MIKLKLHFKNDCEVIRNQNSFKAASL